MERQEGSNTSATKSSKRLKPIILREELFNGIISVFINVKNATRLRSLEAEICKKCLKGDSSYVLLGERSLIDIDAQK